jgi:hypothetical protein
MTRVCARGNIVVMWRPIALALVLLASCGPVPSAATTPSVGASATTLRSATGAASSPSAAAILAPSPSPTLTARVFAEAQIWAEIRATLPPGTPVAVPTWLPATIDRDHVELRDLRADVADPRYVVAYLAGSKEIVLALGSIPEIAGSGYGIRVRSVTASLTFPISLWSDPTAPAMRRVRWVESGRVLSISSDRFTGDDLLHIAWSLDPAGQPGPVNPFARVSEGTCAKVGATPEDTVRALIALTGQHQNDAILDCFANEYIGEYGFVVGTIWGDLPTATLVDMKSSVLGGRPVILAVWMFASDPGGPWSVRTTRFFDLALANGRWRIHAVNSGAAAPPP